MRPARHWRSYGNDPLPTQVEALGEPSAAFPSWFLRECDRGGKAVMINESYAATTLRGRLFEILARMHHDGCGDLPARAELLTGIDGVSSHSVRRVVFRAG